MNREVPHIRRKYMNVSLISRVPDNVSVESDIALKDFNENITSKTFQNDELSLLSVELVEFHHKKKTTLNIILRSAAALISSMKFIVPKGMDFSKRKLLAIFTHLLHVQTDIFVWLNIDGVIW